MKQNRDYIKKISKYSIVGGLGATLVLGLVGCDSGVIREGDAQSETQESSAIQKSGAFVVIEKDVTGNYKIVEEFPSKETRVILRENGTDRILSQAEIDALIKAEEVKIDNGTSELTKSPEEVSSGGMGMGAAILSSMAGALLGSYIGNKLFNNQNYQTQRNTRYQNPSTYSRSVDSFNKQAATTKSANTAPKKSGYFGGGDKSGNQAVGG